ncbi:unnamed protein product [Cuscuta campestris]|uniref:Uncharacterized protein n=1 Tax=Cuscuta campestris TaxID=132261 RepID=A0A484MYJ8_9ASTE|nr:unnamed protein product [Cuscuta campestris]
MEDALSRLDKEDESSSFEWASAFDRLGDPKAKKPRTSAFDRVQVTRSARKGDLRETLKERRGESTATSKIGSEERRKAVKDKEAVELWRMYERLEKRLDAQNPYRQAVFSEVTPFSGRIMFCPLPDNIKTPQVKAHNGTTDTQDHLTRFGANVVMYAYPEEIKCRCFLATLEGQACEWFHKLPKGSIDKWSDLAHKFLEHFASSRRQKLPFSHLLNVKIRKGEQLLEFINRWEKEARDVQGADDHALIAMLQAALPQGDVRKELRRNPLSTYQEMLARAKYLALEEEEDEPPVRKEKKSGPPVAEGKKRKDYDAPKYCEYHRNSTQNTSECVTLKKEMEQLIARGPPPRPERPSSGNRTSRRPAAPTAAVTAGEGQEDERRHLGRDSDDLDEEERQGRQHLGCRFIMGGNTGGDSASSRRKWKNMVHLAEVQRPPLLKRKRKEPLVFTDEDYPPVLSPHRDALVIRVEINNVVVHRTLVDTGNSVNIMYSNTFRELGLSRSDLKPIRTPLSGFTADTIEAEGTVTVKAGVGDGTHRLWLDMEFMVVQLDCTHHLILGRPGLEDLECVISPVHLCLKFSTPTGVGVAKGNQSLSRSCYVGETKSQARVAENVSTTCAAIQKEEGRPRAKPAEEVEEVILDPAKPEQKVKVGKTLPHRLKEQLLEVLQAFKVLFAWGPEDMPGVDPKIICHRLAVDPTHKPIKQKKRFLSSERREFVTKQVTTLQSIGHIRKVSNNEAEYEALLCGLRLAASLKAERIQVWCDSKLIVSHVTGEFEAKDERMKRYRDTTLELLKAFGAYRMEQVPREENAKADILSKLGPDSPDHIRAMTQEEELLEPSISPGQKLMEEIYEGICSAHQGAFTMSRKITLQGYFWPTIIRDCAEYVRKCKVCEEFQKVPGRPATNYTPISTVIPFARWGIDLVGILPRGARNNVYLVVAIDYLTKWVEAAPVPTITEEQMRKFVSKQILCRFGTNGRVENTNRTIVDGLKKKIMECKSAWVEELPYILWTYRITPRKATGETPFALTYGFEARAPAETSLLSYGVETFDAQENEENLRAEMHLIDERRERAYIRAENYHRQVKS